MDLNAVKNNTHFEFKCHEFPLFSPALRISWSDEPEVLLLTYNQPTSSTPTKKYAKQNGKTLKVAVRLQDMCEQCST